MYTPMCTNMVDVINRSDVVASLVVVPKTGFLRNRSANDQV